MAFKEYNLQNVGTIKIFKRKRSSSLKISITSTGEVRVSQPVWLPYSAGITFATSKQQWIAQNKSKTNTLIQDGQQVGKQYYIRFVHGTSLAVVRTRITPNEALVIMPPEMAPDGAEAQQAARKVTERALKKEGDDLLLRRLSDLAFEWGFSYSTSSLKKLKGRWGSCSNQKHITLNIFLLELPWHLIDYVLIHELVHTKHLNHSADFWDEFERCLPNAKQLRKEIHQYQPKIGAFAG